MSPQKRFSQINKNHELKIQPSTTRLKTADQMPLPFEGTVSVPLQLGPKEYEHTFYVLIEEA